ncbi:hypothetical protein NDU88_007075 [Pleurodeles waltl]|uniref:Uncharacterized protein n=1 Tax=Pleurodeles waltl TaxID=8319 RepID=A0AAV7NZW1_PLEWA|nr:hypothetical protein NDU88_007075 [Pleurodeles waltl]
MLLDIQASSLRYLYTPSQPVRSVIKRVIYDVITAVAGIAGFVRVLPQALKISMAPKTTRNSGDKLDGSKMTRVGRDKGDLAGANRCPTSTTGKPIGKNTVGALRVPSSTLGIEELQNIPSNPKGWNKAIEKDLKSSDWAKDSSDKFYYLTEESDLSSGEHSFSESGSSETSETGNKSSSNEPTVWQMQRQRKCTKIQPGPQEGLEIPTSTGGRTLKWDSSGIRLTDTPTTSGQELVNNNMEGNTGGPASNICSDGADSGMLQSIYNSIKELQTETRIESRCARVTTKRLQGTVRKVAKSCTEIEAKFCSMDERIGAVEEDVDALKQQSASRDDQLTDVMWKLEDFENRQRRNNLRFLGIPEGMEGSDIRTYMVKLLRGAFPELAEEHVGVFGCIVLEIISSAMAPSIAEAVHEEVLRVLDQHHKNGMGRRRSGEN